LVLNFGFFLNFLMSLINLRLTETNFRLNLLNNFSIRFLIDRDFRNFFKFEKRLLNGRLINKNAIIFVKEARFLFLDLNDWSNINHLRFRSSNKDVTPDFLAKTVSISSTESKEGVVVARGQRSTKLESDINLLVWQNWACDLKRFSRQVITVCLNEDGVFRPRGLSSISKCPCFDK